MSVATITVSVLKGYTAPVGTGACAVADVTLVSPANAYTYPAGGFAISAKGLGLRGFDFGEGAISQAGNYAAKIQISKATTPVSGSKTQTAYLRLFVPSTGAEVGTGAAVTVDVVRCMFLGG